MSKLPKQISNWNFCTQTWFWGLGVKLNELLVDGLAKPSELGAFMVEMTGAVKFGEIQGMEISLKLWKNVTKEILVLFEQTSGGHQNLVLFFKNKVF